VLSPVKLRKVCQSGNKEGKRLLLKTSNSASVSCFYRDKQGIKGLPPLSPAPQIPAEAPPLRSGKPSSLRMVVDEAEHFPAQSACQRRFAPTAVRLHRNAVRLPAGIDVHLQRNTQQHREIEWASRSSFNEEFELVIMIAVATEEMHGSDRVLT
jgi:hypothetical protein